ncbi:RagB/SusD family nutrient uptake outer membrane protein [Neolewinella litorea]|uniref:RagB/SusD family nutrient uptake outer membrane protein n=1 Tax=Neolewinella litorea TaxID=2562452 RepID=A0A4S4NAN3_9BACT|nr:RagB/SusD family nutrient uptake outer membrane protein [Neolewinella litorea]THH36392.1 RagB/SusD family nutrient uptake outer membrane protein [Neolewinella litorea]
MNAIKLAILLLLGGAGYSCSEFLEEEPRSSASLNQFFTEPAHAENAVNALYRDGAPALWMNGGVYNGRNIMYGPYLSGFFENNYKGQYAYIGFAQQLQLNAINSNSILNDYWSQMYREISRANNAIKYIPTTPGLNDAQVDRLLGEARFFRAWAYFMLVRHFGDVPLITEPYESTNDIYRARSSSAEVYALIVQDLEFAVNSAGLANTNMVSNGYRVSRPAAAALLADVQLTRSGFPLQNDNYAAAADAARLVINSGAHSLAQNARDASGELIPENSAYNKIRRQEVIATEFVYPIEFAIGIAGSGYPAYTYPVTLTSQTNYGITNQAYEPRDQFLAMYDEDEDLRIQNKQLWHNTYTDEDGNTTTFRFQPYLWHDDQALFGTTNPANSELEVAAYTYAEVLLIAAEAIARSEGVTAEAVDYLTQVRSRAYYRQSADEISGALSELSVQEFVEEVWAERNRELALNFKIWYDMIRTRKYPEATDGTINFVDLIGHKSSWGPVFEEKHLLLPLPDQELQRNAELNQNVGY